MAAVAICSDSGAQGNEICHVSIVSPPICHDGTGCHDLTVFECWVLSQLFHSPLSPSLRGSLVTLQFLLLEWYHLHIWGYWHFSGILIPTWTSSSLAFPMMYSAQEFNKQGDNIQPWCTPFPIGNQSVFPCTVLTVASWPAYRLLMRKVRWSGILIC